MSSLTRGEQKSLALHRTLADRLRGDPSLVGIARARLDWLRTKNPAGRQYYDEWCRLLDGPLDELLDVMVSPSELACALRQENPFVDLVDQKERARLFRAVADAVDAGQST
jgi:hypothetical protein